MRVRAIKSFVWQLRDVDIGDEFDVSKRDAFILIHGYGDCVPVDGPAPPLPTAMVMNGDPTVSHRDPVPQKKRKGAA